jgi:FMN phosphatase YigB (HAD superfamily)
LASRFLPIDNRTENVVGAEAVGMKTTRFERANALRRELKYLGVFEEI